MTKLAQNSNVETSTRKTPAQFRSIGNMQGLGSPRERDIEKNSFMKMKAGNASESAKKTAETIVYASNVVKVMQTQKLGPDNLTLSQYLSTPNVRTLTPICLQSVQKIVAGQIV